MERNVTAVLKEALVLPEDDRAEIAGALLESLEPAGADAEVEAAWRQEVAARVAARDAGEVESIPWEEVRDGLFARLRARRAG
jgi:putative addiction module component (TIGR02574 family)